MCKMKLMLATLVLSASMLVGCASDSGKKFAEHFWAYRDNYVYRNPALSDLQKESAIYADGAVLGKDSKELEAELKEKLAKDGE